MNSIKKRSGSIAKYLDVVQVFGVFMLMFIALSISLPNFFSIMNITNLSKQLAVSLIIGAGMTIVIIGGELDLSVGSVLALSGVLAGLIIQKNNIFLVVIVSLFVGLSFGLLNGILITKGKIPSFIATLGTMMIARSLTYVFSNGRAISNFPENYKIIGQGSILGIPIIFLLVILTYTIFYILLKKTSFGQSVYAVGSNRTASILCGINADAIKIRAMVLLSVVASLCGILLTSRAMAIQAEAGKGLELEVIAGVIIGGASLSGGKGNILQTIVGILIIGMIRNGLNLSHVNIYFNDFVTGSIIILALLLDSLRKNIQNRFYNKRTVI